MKAQEINTTIVDGYIGLLDNLSPNDKLELISKLTDSVKTDLKNKKSSFKKAFGAFDSEKSAEEIIEEIRSSRTFTRKIISL
jgi:putative IMPACT (imprinted ancient) family translation regulator